MIAAPFKRLFYHIVEFYYRVFPKKPPKYFDAEIHEKKYIGRMAIVALILELYIESFAKLTISPLAGIKWMFTSPLVFLFNSLILFATMTIALLFRRRKFALFVVCLLWFVVGSVNGIILLQRVTPFTLYDLGNVADGLTIAAQYYESWQLMLIGIGAVLGLAILVAVFRRSVKWKNINYKKSVAVVLLTIAATLCATTAAIHFGVVGTYFSNLNYAFRDYGYPYGFLATSADAGISKPKGYSEEMIDTILEEKTSSGTDTILTETDDDMSHPNIIVLQMESFTTADSYSHISVDRDPTPVFTSLKERYTSGWFEVPACGAGTSNTEFEVLTGISARFFGPGEYPYKGKLREETVENMAYIAKYHGYATSAFHDHRALFYNRNEVYANMGFDSFTSVEYMNTVSFTPTNWCKDTNLIPEIMEVMNQTEERDMMHIVSVEGHGKYPTEQVFKYPYTTVSCEDEETRWKYEYYLNECHEMDTFIGDLIKAIEAQGEPTVMVIYGDHIPALDVTEDIYNGPNLYQTEYVIWDNIGLKEEDKDICAYQVGAELLEAAGLSGEGVIFDYEQNNSAEDESYFSDLETLSYDIMYGDKYAYHETTPYQPTNMTMGHKMIEIVGTVKIGNKYYIKGKNFTARSIITLKGKQLSTTYLSPTLLALNEKVDVEDVPLLEVSQVDKSEEEILTTVGANEEL